MFLRLAEHFRSMEALLQATPGDIAAVPTVGPKIAQSVWAYGQEAAHGALIGALRAAGLQLRLGPEMVPPGGGLAGKKVVLSGQFQHLTRAALQARIQQQGGKVFAAVSKQTDCLVVGLHPGAAKLAAAQALGTTVLSETACLDLMEER